MRYQFQNAFITPRVFKCWYRKHLENVSETLTQFIQSFIIFFMIFKEYSNSPEINTESKFSINLVTEFGINGSNSFIFFTNSYSSQIKHYEYIFNLVESECFLSKSVTELMSNFDSVLISGELLYYLVFQTNSWVGTLFSWFLNI